MPTAGNGLLLNFKTSARKCAKRSAQKSEKPTGITRRNSERFAGGGVRIIVMSGVIRSVKAIENIASKDHQTLKENCSGYEKTKHSYEH